ncbi:MAG: PIN domain-containing protein [Microthrixaceae bacterium]
MILLDTNVVSEPLRPDPSGRVVEWLDAQALEAMFLPVIAVAELRYGIEVMPAGRRREALAERIEGEVLPLFINRVLPVDVAVTASFAKCMATAATQRRGGKCFRWSDRSDRHSEQPERSDP